MNSQPATSRTILFIAFATIFVLLVMVIVLFVQITFLKIQVSMTGDSLSVYRCSVNDIRSLEPQDAVDYLVYVYAYYPPNSRFLKHKTSLSNTNENGRYITLLLLVEILEKKTGDHFGTDLRKWAEKYASDTSKALFYDAIKYRQKEGIGQIFEEFSDDCPVPVQRLSDDLKTEAETQKPEEK